MARTLKQIIPIQITLSQHCQSIMPMMWVIFLMGSRFNYNKIFRTDGVYKFTIIRNSSDVLPYFLFEIHISTGSENNINQDFIPPGLEEPEGISFLNFETFIF